MEVGAMKGELMSVMKMWIWVGTSLSYCYWMRRVIPPGPTRLVSLLPVISLFLFLPLTFSTVHLSGTLAFFLAWLANFKLLLLAFDKGPLSLSSNLPRFAALACLPINIHPKPNPHPSNTNTSHPFPFHYAFKALVVALLVKAYDYTQNIHPKLIMCMYCFHIYLLLEIILALVAALARTLLGLELEPQFNNPLRSTSLQDFWGRRWNLMVTTILRPTVYHPTLRAAATLLGPKWAPLPAVFATFLVSGLMHELILFYIGRMEPTFWMTAFFLLHGLSLTVEIALKRALAATFRLPSLVSGPLTAAFVFATCISLFLPEFIRCRIDVRAFQEYAALGQLFTNLASRISPFFHTHIII